MMNFKNRTFSSEKRKKDVFIPCNLSRIQLSPFILRSITQCIVFMLSHDILKSGKETVVPLSLTERLTVLVLTEINLTKTRHKDTKRMRRLSFAKPVMEISLKVMVYFRIMGSTQTIKKSSQSECIACFLLYKLVQRAACQRRVIHLQTWAHQTHLRALRTRHILNSVLMM